MLRATQSRTRFPIVRPRAVPGFVAVLLLALAGQLFPAQSQQLPRQATDQFRQALEHLRAQHYAAAEPLLSQLVRQFPEHVDLQEALAIVLAAQGRLQAATSHFEKVVKLRPDSARARQNLGAHYLRLGSLPAAEREFQQALSLEPDNANAHFNLGSLYLSQQQFEDALPHLQRTYQSQPGMAENAYKLALCYFFLRRHEEAGQLLAALEPQAREQAEVLLLLGLNHAALGHEADAKSAFDRALRQLPPSPETYETLGQMFFELGLHAEAVPVFERAFENKPDSYPVAYALALAYQGAGQGEKARTAAQKALQKWETADLHHLLGGVNEELGSYVEAVQHFQRAAEMDPSERNVYDLGYEFLVHWSWDAAAAVFQKGVQLHPQSERLLLGLAAAYFSQGEFDLTVQTLLQAPEAASGNAMANSLLVDAFARASGYTDAVQRRLRRFQQRHPDDPWTNYYYGLSLAQVPDRRPSEEELAEATRLFQRAVALQPDLSEAHYQLGVLLFEQRQWREAVPALEAAVRVKPDFVEAHYRLALAYQRGGNSAQAKATLARYRKLKEQQDAELERRESQRTKFIYSLKP